MKILDNRVRKNGFDYYLVQRNTKSAVYEQKIYNKTIAYEVFKIKIRKEENVFGRIIEKREKFPSNEDFGKNAWTFKSLDKAKEIYNKL